MIMNLSLLIFIVLFYFVSCKQELLLLTVATEETPGFHRYLRSVSLHGLDGKVLGMGEKWKGGDMNFPGGGHKINLLKKEMENYKDRKDLIILFTDSYDVIVAANQNQLLETFASFNAKVVFGAEIFCWPDSNYASRYPKVKGRSPYLNSGMFMGYAPILYELLFSKSIENEEDDQLFYTELFLEVGNKYNIKLDSTSKLFQNLNGVTESIEIQFQENGSPFVFNSAELTQPLVIHGNGPSKIYLNSLGNYVPLSWNLIEECTSCKENNVENDSLLSKKVLIGIFISKPTPFLEEFFEKILGLEYPFQNLDFFLYNEVPYHDKDVEAFILLLRNKTPKIRTLKVLRSHEKMEVWTAKNTAVEHCAYINCDYFFHVDSEAHLDNPKVLSLLLSRNKPIIAPMLVRPNKAWSNFWGALGQDGYYARSFDYMDIVNNKRRGVWNVPFISTCYLVESSIIKSNKMNYIHELLDADMAVCKNWLESNEFLYVTNLQITGHLINNDNTYNIKNSELYNDMWQVFENPLDWEARYLHENYSQILKEGTEIREPCPDVFHVPFASKRFAHELIQTMEHFGKWSDGSSTDKRLEGGYEAVPTRDIHMNQINFEKEWLEILRKYVSPIQQKVFIGHDSYPPRSIMNFVVRYRPDEQPSLRPHHDSSTYTINIALNEDYEGGGCRFIRYNCSIVKSSTGWLTMHPGRLTHYHEGLTTTQGTRYIMISFVDP